MCHNIGFPPIAQLVIRDIGLTWLIATAVVLMLHISSVGTFTDYSGIFAFALLFMAQLELGNHTFDEYKQAGRLCRPMVNAARRPVREVVE